MGAAEIRHFLAERIAELSGMAAAEIDCDRPFEEFGLASRDAVAIAGELEERLDRGLPATLVWEYPTINRLSEGLAGGSTPAPATPTGEAEEPIAVVGIGCRLPGGIAGPARFWHALIMGEDCVGEVPEGRWDDFHEAGDLIEATSRHGGYLDDVAGFDAEFFGISPREAETMDPQQRMLLEVTWEALDHAAIAPGALRGGRTGVFTGISGNEYGYLSARDPGRIEAWTATGAAMSIAAGRLSYLLDLRGPSLAVDTACSSSLVATHLAVRSLRAGESDLALAAGVNLLLSPVITRAFDQAGGTSPDGRCKAFDAGADGMVRAEGCGVVALKRLSDATRDGDRVLALITATGVNQDGRSNGLVAPNPEAQEALLREVHGDRPDVDYVEAHGTGTLLGDPIEARVIDQVLGRDDDRLLIGSAKSNLGHLEAAAGIAGLIKAVLALHHGLIPPSLHFHEPSPHISWDRLRVVDEPTPWPRRGRPPRAAVSGFGFGGTNAHAVLEAAPEAEAVPDVAPNVAPEAEADDAGTERSRLFVLTDASAERVRDQAVALAAWLRDEGADVPLPRVAHTLARRAERGGRGRVRGAALAADHETLIRRLGALSEGRPETGTASGAARPGTGEPVFVFSGYGSQWSGMGRRLLETEPAFAAAVDELDPLFRDEGVELRAAIAAGAPASGVALVQPVLCGIQIALARTWESYGVRPAAVVGHSMGEVAAAVVSGGLATRDAVKVICRRARMLGTLGGGGAMGVVQIPAEEVPIDLHVAVYSSPGRCVVTGDPERVAELVAEAEARGLPARLLTAEGAGHSPQVDPLLPELGERLAGVTGTEPDIPVFSTVADDLPPFDTAYWQANLRRPVRLAQALAAAARAGYTAFIEVSPHPVLGHAIAETVPGAFVAGSLRRDSDESLATQIATVAANGHPPATSGAVADVPAPPWRHVRHWVSPPAGRRSADGHPLLGTGAEVPGDERFVWRSEPEPEPVPAPVPAPVPEPVREPEWFPLAGEVRILSLAAVAEMAVAAAAEVLGGADLVAEDVCLEGILPIAAEASLTTTADLAGTASVQVEVHARNAAGAWRRYGSATVTRLGRPGGRERPAGRRYRIDPAALAACLERDDGRMPVEIGILRVDREGGCDADDVRYESPGHIPMPLGEKLLEAKWVAAPLPEPPMRRPARRPSPTALDRPGLRDHEKVLDHAFPEELTDGELSSASDLVFQVPADKSPEELVLRVARLAARLVSLPRTPRLWLAAPGALAVRDGEAGEPDRAALRGLVRSLAFERPGLRATLVDASPEEVRREVAAGARDDEVAWRGGSRYARRLARAGTPEVPRTPVVRRSGSYVISGGYGGLGLVVAGWLAERGARRIILSGRSGPSPDGEKTISRLRETGTDVRVVAGDVAVPGVAERLVAEATADGVRLCGIAHAAGVLDDHLVTDIGPDDVHRVFGPKVRGGLRLHEAAPAHLDWFVMFSSAAALLGSPGQGAYAAANAWLDALAARRRAHGLTATTINWGQWSEVGGAVLASLPGLRPISPDEGVEALEALLKSGRPAAGVVSVDADAAVAAFPELGDLAYFSELVELATRATVEGGGRGLPCGMAGADGLRDMAPEDVRQTVGERLAARSAAVLGLEPSWLDRRTPLVEAGLDSLAATRIRNAVQHDFGVEVPATVLLQRGTLADLEEAVAAALDLPAAPGLPPTTRDQGISRVVGARDAAERQVERVARQVLGRRVSMVERLDEEASARVATALAVRPRPTLEEQAGQLRDAEEAEAAADIVRTIRDGSGVPLILGHPAGGTTGVYTALAGHIGGEHPILGLERFDDDVSLEERAARYVEHIKERLPEGPYRLGGWSFGGVLAYEIACRLGAASVELVAMLDSGLPRRVGDPAARSARRYIGFARYVRETYGVSVDVSLDELTALDEDAQVALLMDRAGAAGLADLVSPAILRHQITSHEDTRAIERYRPGPYGGRVILYRATEPTPWAVNDDRYEHMDDPTRGFGPFCSNLEVVPISGSHHLNLLDPPHVEIIAEHLRRQL